MDFGVEESFTANVSTRDDEIILFY